MAPREGVQRPSAAHALLVVQPGPGRVGGQSQIIFGGGDGFCYGFDFVFTKDKEGHAIFKELWRCDANPKQLRVDEAGKPREYWVYDGPSEIMPTARST